MRALLLHGYDARNRGDGELVRLSIEVIRSALGPQTDITLLALAPETFEDMVDRALPALPRTLRDWRTHRRRLHSFDEFDAVFAVGGGYLRASNPIEAAKTIGAHLPQLRAAARASVPTCYLPQSVGPLLPGLRRAFLRPLRHIDLICVRDDRSRRLVGPAAMRLPDLAALASPRPATRPMTDTTAVLCVRDLRGSLPAPVLELSRRLAPHDVFVQSQTRGNDDLPATKRLAPRRIIPTDEILAEGSAPRIVIAMRLHGALLALRAGHFVIHLAYERKGFGAFEDLGLADYVVSATRFDPADVSRVVAELSEPRGQDRYRGLLEGARDRLAAARGELLAAIRETVAP